jgi:hypothetical protein
MATQKHKDYTDYIIRSIQSINPHNDSEGRTGYVYAAGFLASYLASLIEEDPAAFNQFKRHIEQRKRELNSVVKPKP